ncbi:MAG: hypothetical protein AAFS10_22180 [Myxococcota bacterium]
MATYKFEAEMRYGKYYGNLRKASDPKPDLTKGQAMSNAAELADFFNTEIERLSLDEDEDTIIFRGCGHNDYIALEREIRFATY